MSATIAMALEYICASFTVAQFRTCLANSPAIFVSISKCICPNFKMYFSQFQNEFVPISKCICHNFKIQLSQFQSVFVPISKCICPNFKIWLSHFQNVFVPISKQLSLLCNLEHALQMASSPYCQNRQDLLYCLCESVILEILNSKYRMYRLCVPLELHIMIC